MTVLQWIHLVDYSDDDGGGGSVLTELSHESRVGGDVGSPVLAVLGCLPKKNNVPPQ